MGVLGEGRMQPGRAGRARSAVPSAPRDQQRSRLYRAENEIPSGRRLSTVEALQDYVGQVAGTPWFLARWGHRSFDVRPGYGHTRATATPDGVLQMPRWARRELFVLHEMAHSVTPVGYAAHGAEYAGILLTLVRHQLGPASGQGLEDAFERHRVRYTMAAVPRRPRRWPGPSDPDRRLPPHREGRP